MSDQHYLKICLDVATHSVDPSTQVGSVIVDPNNQIVVGYNRFPPNIANTPERWNDRDLKIKLVVHAEISAMIQALQAGFDMKRSILYVWARDTKTGITWGGSPCVRCAVELIAAGIGEIRVPVAKGIPERWVKDLNLARDIILESGVKYTELDL